MTTKRSTVLDLGYTRLNLQLLACEDVAQMERWLAETIPTGSLYRALRIHGRLNAVRRRQEIDAIKKAVADVGSARR